MDPNVIEADAMVKHKPNFVPSYTAPLLNGLPGALYNGSHGRQFFPNKMTKLIGIYLPHALASSANDSMYIFFFLPNPFIVVIIGRS